MIDKLQSLSSVIQTEDGSDTLISSIFQERYHSIHGARQESQTVFIDAGLKAKFHLDEIHVLELGFGTGLNALMTWKESTKFDGFISYAGYEKFPIDLDTAKSINYGDLFNMEAEYNRLHEIEWGNSFSLDPKFTFCKIQSDISEITEKERFDVIYYDAFAPAAQEELWTIDIFSRMYNCMKKDGVLVTYCAKGQVKRNMKAAGFKLESLPGPKGKREMTRARKPL